MLFSREFSLAIIVLALAVGVTQAAESQVNTDQRVQSLIEQLGSDDYFARERAQNELIPLGEKAFDALQEATTRDDLEIAARARYLLQVIRQQRMSEGELRDYDRLSLEARLLRMRQLKEMSNYQGVPALCRLVQFELSPIFSKSAAIELLDYGRSGKAPSEKLITLLRQHLGSSRRPAAHWLMIFARYREDPSIAIADWEKVIAEEENVLQTSPRQTNSRIVSMMRRMQVDWLDKQGRKGEAMTAMRQLIELEKGDPTILANLAEWLIDRKAWEVFNEAAKKFAGPFASEPRLLYALAQSQIEQGDQDGAEATAKRALEIHFEPQSDEILRHLQIATHLRQRGLFDWAEREFRHVIEHQAAMELAVLAQYQLSEMFHGQQQDLKAAEILAECNRRLGKGRSGDDEIVNLTVKEIRSRMHYFYACHWQAQGDQIKFRQSLDAALAAYPADVDVLIAAYRIANATPEYRSKIRDLIRKAADELRDRINDNDDDNVMNQFAWLIGNTEGDLDEALKYSLLSVKNNPDIGAFYDTLAHVYYAKGDYQNAVEYQTRAVELDPHFGLIRQQLEVFKKKLAESKS